MLTDRPDVPHTLFGRLKPPNGFFGQTQERTYSLNDNVSKDFYSMFYVAIGSTIPEFWIPAKMRMVSLRR